MKTDPAAIFVRRSHKSGASRYARIDNAILQNAALSFRARGVLAYILSRPTNWQHCAEKLTNSKDGRHAILAALHELVAAGHARQENRRLKNGHFKKVWLFSESPAGPAPSAENQHSAPSAGLPTSVGPSLGGTARYERTVGETTVGETTVSLASAAKPAPAGKRSAKSSTPRSRDPVLDALATLDGSTLAEVTRTGWSGTAKALADIRQVSPAVTVEEIRQRAANYRAHFRDATISPHALAKWWGKCGRPPGGRDAHGQPEPALRMISA